MSPETAAKVEQAAQVEAAYLRGVGEGLERARAGFFEALAEMAKGFAETEADLRDQIKDLENELA